MELIFGKEFKTRQEITSLLGGDMQIGIAASHNYPVILIFTNEARFMKIVFIPQRGMIIVCILVLVEVVIRIVLLIICII